jgi:hypothetical protein
MRVLILVGSALPIALAIVALASSAPPAPPPKAPAVVDKAPPPPNIAQRVAALRDVAGQAPRVVPRAGWDDSDAPRRRIHAYGGDLHETFTHVVVHHSDLVPPPGPAGILAYHLEHAGFADIGYHFVVAEDGTIYEGRDLRYMGAHAGVSWEQRRGGARKDPDHGAIGVVLDGYFGDRAPPDPQLRAAVALVEDLRRRFGIPRRHVIGHREVARELVTARGLSLRSSPTVCPGDAMHEVVEALRAKRLSG